jgi:hypothetical protein
VSSEAGKTTTSGQPYLVSGILIAEYNNLSTPSNQEINLLFN